jgi:membrane peptidoglycan carboxypeptidase
MREKSSLLLFGQAQWLSVSSESGWLAVPPSCRLKLFLSLAFLVSVQAASAQSLRQALEPKLARLSANSRSAVLLWDLPRSEPLVAVREEVFTVRRCLGSLVKPFLLLAYLNEHCSDLPSHPLEVPPCPREGDPSNSGSVSLELRPCVGRATLECPVECWYKPGHGELEMSRALAVSCNQYFYQLSKQTLPAAFFRTLATLGISVSAALTGAKSIPPETMMGLDSNLKLVPLQVLKAYAALIFGGLPAETESSTPAFARSIVLNGLKLGAVQGTSSLAQQALPPNHHLLGKTGTSPAFRGGRYLTSRTDGWFLGFYPAAQPVLAVMVYYPDGLGAKDAAPLGGQAIRMYLEMVK